MEKIKQNKIWITIVVIGIIVIGILLAMLHQQKQNSPEAQSSSYVSSAKASSASTSVQDKNNEKAYAKKAAKMKGHVYSDYFTSWSKQDFKNWANEYLAKPESERHQDGVKESFGTSTSWENSDTNMTYPLDKIANQIQTDGVATNYYDTVKEFNKANPGFNPDDIKK
ncbi:hypothetical protein FGL72_03720 [Leuconostoc citreum]|uniref:hypothetical protein n=1 Tax=Leuconostoc TaxID=1243 RepID=UPI0011BB3EA4|nr:MULTISPECIES: hypothetical protein [Leuconostoc]QEA46274.1 hypothetical protein FGL82_07785 [Leuconostoc citreum]QEA62964.1 hypothetical protein FGL72_03720 [Leuconostoc citreum]